jgi:hypothetical protein
MAEYALATSRKSEPPAGTGGSRFDAFEARREVVVRAGKILAPGRMGASINIGHAQLTSRSVALRSGAGCHQATGTNCMLRPWPNGTPRA